MKRETLAKANGIIRTIKAAEQQVKSAERQMSPDYPRASVDVNINSELTIPEKLITPICTMLAAYYKELIIDLEKELEALKD